MVSCLCELLVKLVNKTNAKGILGSESFGYIEPGHGARGKQRWLTSADDLKDMYSTHQGKKEILLWC